MGFRISGPRVSKEVYDRLLTNKGVWRVKM
jgi:hypothetical protein